MRPLHLFCICILIIFTYSCDEKAQSEKIVSISNTLDLLCENESIALDVKNLGYNGLKIEDVSFSVNKRA